MVSLCKVGDDDTPATAEHIEVRLIDADGADKNPNLGFVVRGTIELLRTLRAEGKTVLLHCVQAQSRTPTIAALYGTAVGELSPADAFVQIKSVLPAAHPIADFQATLQR